MLLLKLLRLILPPFHPLKYRYINWYYGEQTGGYFMTEDKFKATLNTNDEHILNQLHDNF